MNFWHFFAVLMMLLCVYLEAHLTVLVLDLTMMRLRNFCKDIDVTDEQLYERCLREDIVSIEVCLVGCLQYMI